MSDKQARVDCDACGGSCTDECDAGAGTFNERQEAELTGRSVSDQRLSDGVNE